MKGGAINYQKPDVDEEHLKDALKDYAMQHDMPFHLYEYQGLWANCKPRVSSLLKLIPLITVLLSVCPEAGIKYAALKKAFIDLFHESPSLKPVKSKVDEAAKHIADKLLVVQKHVRIIKNNFDEFTDKLSASERRLLEETLSSLPASEGKVPSKATPEQSPRKRALARHKSDSSEVSVDGTMKRLSTWISVSCVEEESILPPTKAKILEKKKQLLEVMKKPASSKVKDKKLKVPAPAKDKKVAKDKKPMVPAPIMAEWKLEHSRIYHETRKEVYSKTKDHGKAKLAASKKCKEEKEIFMKKKKIW